MVPPVSPLASLLARMVAPLEPAERAILLAALEQPEEFVAQLSLALDQASESSR